MPSSVPPDLVTLQSAMEAPAGTYGPGAGLLSTPKLLHSKTSCSLDPHANSRIKSGVSTPQATSVGPRRALQQAIPHLQEILLASDLRRKPSAAARTGTKITHQVLPGERTDGANGSASPHQP